MSQNFAIEVEPLMPSVLIRILESGSPEVDQYLGTEVYANPDPGYLAAQRKRLAETVRLHAKRIGARPTYLLRAPGRLNAFLEYLDMCAGDHMSTTIDGDIPAAVSPREDDILSVVNANPLFLSEDISISEEFGRFTSKPLEENPTGLEDNWDNRSKLLPHFGRPKGSWLNYVLSPFLRVAWDYPGATLKGVDLTFGPATIPFRAGASSSSALVVISFLALYLSNRKILPALGITDVCRLLGEAEWYVGTHGGANDQTTILCNRPNSVLYNRHSREPLESTPLPFLRGLHIVLANSLWEANKSLTGNQSFNMRKAWMDIGDTITKQIISNVCAAISEGKSTGDGWISRVLNEALGFDFIPELPILEANPQYWEKIAANYKMFGSLDEAILGIPNQAIEELICILPTKIDVEGAARLLNTNTETIERIFAKPKRMIGGYHARTTARFFHKENIIGRELERTFLEAESRLASGEISADSKEYDAYQVKVGAMLDDLQRTLRFDFRVSNSQLDRLLEIARLGPGYLGGKLTGAGKGGCVCILVRDTQSSAMCEYLDREYYGKPANFEEYRQTLEDALRYCDADDYERISAEERLGNLERALTSIEEQRRVIIFSRGACALKLPLPQPSRI